MPEVPDVAYLELAPDWVCEVLSVSTAAFDRVEKLPVYAEARVEYAWLIDAKLRTLEILRLTLETKPPRWCLPQTFDGESPVRVEPFDAIELRLGRLWGWQSL